MTYIADLSREDIAPLMDARHELKSIESEILRDLEAADASPVADDTFAAIALDRYRARMLREAQRATKNARNERAPPATVGQPSANVAKGMDASGKDCQCE